jgi:hypothetical protein
MRSARGVDVAMTFRLLRASAAPEVGRLRHVGSDLGAIGASVSCCGNGIARVANDATALVGGGMATVGCASCAAWADAASVANA